MGNITPFKKEARKPSKLSEKDPNLFLIKNLKYQELVIEHRMLFGLILVLQNSLILFTLQIMTDSPLLFLPFLCGTKEAQRQIRHYTREPVVTHFSKGIVGNTRLRSTI